MDLKGFIKEQGYDLSEVLKYRGHIDVWESWVKGDVKDFHSYRLYNGNAYVRMKKTSLGGAKKVCEDWADLLYNEKVKISITEAGQDALDKVLLDNKFAVLVNKAIERGFGLGTSALVLSVNDLLVDENGRVTIGDESRIKIERVSAKKIFPLSWSNDEITECAFAVEKTEKGQNYVYLSMHILNEQGNYVIKNFKLKKTRETVSYIEEDQEGIISEFDTKGKLPWFAIIKPNICNNIDEESPYGISVFANSISVLKALDNAYNGLDQEVVQGKRRTFISEDMLTYSDGEQRLVFDENDISVYVLPKSFNDKSTMIQHDNESLRTDQLEGAVNYHLNILSSKVGFGQERYKFDNGAIQTATGVISANSDMFRTIKKHEQVLEPTLIHFIQAIIYASNNYTTYKIQFSDEDEIKIDFDDSIIEDKGAEKTRAMQEVNAGLRSKQSYLEEYRNMSEDAVEDEMNKMAEERQALMKEREEEPDLE